MLESSVDASAFAKPSAKQAALPPWSKFDRVSSDGYFQLSGQNRIFSFLIPHF
jgi:hypothetical protein